MKSKRTVTAIFHKIFHTPFYVVLFAIYPAIFMFSNNKTEVQGWMIIRPLFVCLVLVAIILILARIGFRSFTKASLFTFVFLVLFFSYGQIYHFQGSAPAWIEPIIRHRFLVLIAVLVLIGTTYLLRRNSPERLTLPLNCIVTILLIFPLVGILSYESRRVQNQITTLDVKSSDVPELSLDKPLNPPDIYYIILDTYTRGDVLQNRFGYDNSPFYDELVSEGAYVATCSRSNYAQTLLSLNSSLNMSHVKNLQPTLNSILDLTMSLNSNIVYQTLRANGYQLITFDNGFPPGTITNSDTYYSPQSVRLVDRLMEGFQSFEAMFYDSTALKIILDQQSSLPAGVKSFIQSPYSAIRETIFYQLDNVDKLPNSSTPKVVHLHIIAPHPPATFGADGQPVDGQKYFTLNPNLVKKREFGRSAYIDEVKYLNQRILEILRTIKANSTRPFAFIVQGDHGTYGFGTGDEYDRIKILNVYYFSDEDYSDLYPGITPINTFRVVFNKYFDAKLPMMPDTTYYSAYDARFDFHELEENYPPCMD